MYWRTAVEIDDVTADNSQRCFGRGRTIGRFKISVAEQDLTAIRIPNQIKNILKKKDRNPQQVKKLNAFFETSNPAFVKIQRQLDQIKKQLSATKAKTTLVMVEMDEPRETRKLIRGDYLNPGKPVKPGVPTMLHPIDPSLPRNRLGLAKWIVDANNPLTSRVVVNRWWAQFFGKGLVVSQEDFGVQAEQPTHPELLDYLANRLIESGWSRKKIHREIVMSATFRQSSNVTRTQWNRDPINKWYSRGPRMRMTAEMIRDNGLTTSGLLSKKIGGSPVMPYQPSGIWRAVGRNAPTWTESKGAERFRRGIYIVWRRAAPYPSFVNFDAPDRAACVVDRSRTNTPLQALTLLNDQAYLEMALAAADQNELGNSGKSQQEKLEQFWLRCVGRKAKTNELLILAKLLEQQQQDFRQNPQRAKQLVQSLSKVKIKSNSDWHELAAWTMVANALFNLDETIHY